MLDACADGWGARLAVAVLRERTSMMSFTTGVFPAPVHTNIATRAAFKTGRVSVTRPGGGFGESEIDATILSFSFNCAARDSEGMRESEKLS